MLYMFTHNMCHDGVVFNEIIYVLYGVLLPLIRQKTAASTSAWSQPVKFLLVVHGKWQQHSKNPQPKENLKEHIRIQCLKSHQ